MRYYFEKMNFLDKWFLRRLCDKITIQGNHRDNIIEYYRVINVSAKNEFTEDNSVTINSFLEDCFQCSLKDK